MRVTNGDEPSLHLKTGWLCLDFANTMDWHASNDPEEHIHSYEDLVSWVRSTGIINDDEARTILQEALNSPTNPKEIHKHAIALREAIYHIFSSVAAGREPPASDLAILNTSLMKALTHLQIVRSKQVFSWGWFSAEEWLERILWPIAHSAALLLTSEEIDRVGECADDRGCGWLFLDKSRNRSRRWCDMKSCGNRDKVRRYYKKKRASA